MLKPLIHDLLREQGLVDSRDSIQIVPLSSCRDDHGNDIVLVFVGSSGRPRAVFKKTRHPRFNFKLETEWRLLRQVGDAGQPPWLPRALVTGRLAGCRFVIQEGKDGEALSSRMLRLSRDGVERDLETCIDLLAWLHGLRPSEVTAEPRNSLSRGPDLDLEVPGSDGLPGRSRERLARAWRAIEPAAGRFVVHGDFWQTNLLIDRKGGVSGLIDWEFGVAGAKVPSDLPWFLINAAYFLAMRETPDVSIDAAFDTLFAEGPIPSLLKAVLARYLAARDIPRERVLPLFLVTLHQMAHRERLAYGRSGAMDEVCGGLLRKLLDRGAEFRLARSR